jgi:hypothetical protein
MTSKERTRARFLWAAFLLTPEDWDKIAAHQGNLCFVCRHRSVGKRLATDHSHETGLVRGLLCSRCNALLGKIENAFKRYGLHKLPGVTVIGVLVRFADYLTNPPAVQALGRTILGYPGKIGTKEYRKWVKKNRAGIDALIEHNG